MKKDIPQYRVEELAIAITPRNYMNSEAEDDLWYTYLVNFYDQPLSSVLVSSKGYGEIDGKRMQTTTLRHFFEEIGPQQIVPLEPIQPSLFDLTNEFWVSFVLNGYMYDKKYIFVRGSIDQQHFTSIPFSDLQGVMIK